MQEAFEEGDEVSSRSTNRRKFSSSPTRCFCGSLSVVRNSWTDLNPARRFWTCENSKATSSCGFFSWVDPPMCERSKVVIPGLLRKVRKMEEERAINQKKIKILWIALILSWSVAMVLWLRKNYALLLF